MRTATSSPRSRSPRKWSQQVTGTSDALDLQHDVFKLTDPKKIAQSLKRSAEYLLRRIGDARFVLLGEASHGTHDFYEARARITLRLVAERGFSAVASTASTRRWPWCWATWNARIPRSLRAFASATPASSPSAATARPTA